MNSFLNRGWRKQLGDHLDTVRPGQRYRSAEGGLFGAEGRDWWVKNVSRYNDGLTYATLVMCRDPSQTKTLAQGTLLNRRLFRLVSDPADNGRPDPTF